MISKQSYKICIIIFAYGTLFIVKYFDLL